MNDMEHDQTIGHMRAVFKNLNSFYREKYFCDTVLVVENGFEFYTHRVLLAASSPYFKQLLQDGGNRYCLPPNFSKTATSSLLEFVYTGSLRVDANNVWVVITAASQMGLTGAVNLCQKFLQMSTGSQIHLGNIAGQSQETGVEKVKEKSRQMVTTASQTNDVTVLYKSSVALSQLSNIEGKGITGVPQPSIDTGFEQTSIKKEQESEEEDADIGMDDFQDPTDDAEDDMEEKEWLPDIVKVESKHRKNVPKHKKDKPGVLKKKRGRPRKQPSSERILKRSKKRESRTSIRLKERKRIGKIKRKDGKPKRSVSKRSRNKTRKNNLYPPRCSMFQRNGKQQSCQICSKKFPFQTVLRFHTKLIHKGIQRFDKWIFPGYQNQMKVTKEAPGDSKSKKTFTCIKCDEQFKLYTLCVKHINAKHSTKPKCKSCNITFTTKRLFRFHKANDLKKQGGITNRPSMRSCTECGHLFLYKKNLTQHIKIKHKTTYKCLYCAGMYKTKVYMREHIEYRCKARSKEPTVYECKPCKRFFSSRRALNGHKVRQLCPNDPDRNGRPQPKWPKKAFRCEEKSCPNPEMAYGNITELKAHMHNVHPETMFTCKYCHFRHSVKSQMESHFKMKHGEGSKTICDQCGKGFRKNYFLKVHRVSVHNIPDDTVKVHKCAEEDCSYFCFQKSNLKVHMRRHTKEKPFTCQVCGKKLKTESNLIKHTKKIHLGIRPYMCDICGVSYGEESELKTHIARHDEVKKFSCSVCEYATSDKGNFHSHMFAKHKISMSEKMKIYKCKYCDFSSDRRGRYNDHVKTHLGIRDHVCSQCGKQFLRKMTLKKHIQWVHSEKTMTCSHCDFVTVDAPHLREHMRVMHTHRDVKPYKCSYCDYRCAVSGNCRKHIATKHKGMEIKWIKVCDKYPDNNPPKVRVPNTKSRVPVEGDMGQYGGANFVVQNDIPPTEQFHQSAAIGLVENQHRMPAQQMTIHSNNQQYMNLLFKPE